MTFVLFGATGDLAKRKIYPALFNLFLDQKMPQSFSIIGLGRRELSDGTFQTNVEHSLRTFSGRFIEVKAKLKEFIEAFRYSQLDVTNKGYPELLNLVQTRERELNIYENRLFYCLLHPSFSM